MKNWEALKALMDGKCVRNAGWKNGLHILPNTTFSDGCHTSYSPEWHLLHVDDDWEIYDPGHDWAWACAELLAGRQVRRKTWVTGTSFVLLKGNLGEYVKCMAYGSGVVVDNAVIARCDLEATDWVSAEVTDGRS